MSRMSPMRQPVFRLEEYVVPIAAEVSRRRNPSYQYDALQSHVGNPIKIKRVYYDGSTYWYVAAHLWYAEEELVSKPEHQAMKKLAKLDLGDQLQDLI